MHSPTSQPNLPSPATLLGSAIAFSAMLTGFEPAWATGVFDAFLGSWTGTGTITSSSGTRESVRCRSSFRSADGKGLAVSVVCASDSYKINLTSNVVAHGSDFSGSWQEQTRQVAGEVRGTLPSPGTMQASLDALGGGVQIAARANGKAMAITIQSQGPEVQTVRIDFHKG